jgi:hypothetical protein
VGYLITALVILGLTTNATWWVMKSQANEKLQEGDRISEWNRGFPEAIRKYRKAYPNSNLPIVATFVFAIFLILLVALVIMSVLSK